MIFKIYPQACHLFSQVFLLSLTALSMSHPFFFLTPNEAFERSKKIHSVKKLKFHFCVNVLHRQAIKSRLNSLLAYIRASAWEKLFKRKIKSPGGNLVDSGFI